MLNTNLLQNYVKSGALMGGEPMDMLIAANGDPGVLRPWLGNDNKTYISLYSTTIYDWNDIS